MLSKKAAFSSSVCFFCIVFGEHFGVQFVQHAGEGLGDGHESMGETMSVGTMASDFQVPTVVLLWRRPTRHYVVCGKNKSST